MSVSLFVVSAVAALLTGQANSAHAQSTPPFDTAVDLHLFEYSPGSRTFLTVGDGDVLPKGSWSADALLTYATKPFAVYNIDGAGEITTVRSQVVRSMWVGELMGAYGLTNRLQVGVSMPVLIALAGDGLDPATGRPAAQDLSVMGTGDLKLEGKFQLISGGASLSVLAGVAVPSSFGSSDSAFLGDNLPGLRLRLMAQTRLAGGRLSLGATGGVNVRKSREIYATTVGQQATFGVAAAAYLTKQVSLVAESFGRSGFTASDDAGVEAGGGLRIALSRSLSLTAGGTTGLLRGIGQPNVRMFIAVGIAPDARDVDGDGLGSRDRCPDVPEDEDGWEDGDGCPDPDDDKDEVDDADDKCRREAEDLDGYQDEDGCPDKDDDADGINDVDDSCPRDKEDGKQPAAADGCPYDKKDSDQDGVMDHMDACGDKAEDADGFEDWDGCPDLDQDKDGIADTTDLCPVCSEDKDGVADSDGCPDVDNDHDGVIDGNDKCPKEAETINGIADNDGCPDAGTGSVLITETAILLTKFPVFVKGELSPKSYPLVDQLAMNMLAKHLVTSWKVAVSGKTEAEALTQAKLIIDAIRARGVTAAIEAFAAEGPPRVAAIIIEQVESDPPPGPFCPVEHAVRERPVPVPPTAAPSSPSAPASAGAKPIVPAQTAPAPQTKPTPGR